MISRSSSHTSEFATAKRHPPLPPGSDPPAMPTPRSAKRAPSTPTTRPKPYAFSTVPEPSESNVMSMPGENASGPALQSKTVSARRVSVSGPVAEAMRARKAPIVAMTSDILWRLRSRRACR